MKKTNFLKLIAAMLLSLSLAFLLASCDISSIFKEGEGPFYITFDSDGGTEIESVTLISGEKLVEPEAPKKSGYIFDGWYNGTLKWNFEDEAYTVTSDMTLTAKWVVNTVQYTVTYDTDGGTLDMASELVYSGETAIGPWVKPKKDGYRFDGWYLGETLWDFATVVPSDITLVAHWVEKSDYLVYDVETTPLHLVYSTNGISKERDNAIYDLFTHLSNILDTEPTLAKDGDRVPIDNEVVVGKTIRIISNRAYGILNMLTREQGERLFIIYVERSRWEEIDGDGEVIYGSEPILSENGYSVSIAYDDSEGDVVAVAAINYFIETYAGEEFAHAPGVLCVGRIAADGTMTVSEPSISAAVPEAEDDPDSLKQDFESVEVGDILPEGMEIAGQDGHELDPMSSITVAQKKNGNKYIKIVTWDTYVHPGAQEWNGWEGYREGYANTDLIIRPKDASETDGYFVASFNMSARYFTSMSYGAGSDKRALFLKLFDTEGNEKISLKFAITDAGYSVIAEGAVNSYPASVNLRENVNFRFVYCIADGLVYCYCDDVLFAAMEYGTAGQAADLGYMRFDFTNSLISQLEIDNVLVANNIASKD